MHKLQSGIDTVSTVISAIMYGLMITIPTVNIILRYLPRFRGFSWYMESSQYLNARSMPIAGIVISVEMQYLKVNPAEDLAKGIGKKIVKILVAVFNMPFHTGMAYGAYLLVTKAKRSISIMPQFKMTQVYWMIPVTVVLSAISMAIGLTVDLKDMDEEGAKA